jgi:hypothetical protein
MGQQEGSGGEQKIFYLQQKTHTHTHSIHSSSTVIKFYSMKLLLLEGTQMESYLQKCINQNWYLKSAFSIL